ncbi:MAG: hypothetical protein NPIRA04_00960 [Nitrospirales bacterium]|nr:MAG: hypothetical protein NPIRA04_00960 [Nitrospirales bacterium]
MDIETFRQMVEKSPKGFLGRYGLGKKIYEEGGNLEEAAENLRVAIELDPIHVSSHWILGQVLGKLGKHDEAKTVLTAGITAATSGRSNGGGDLVPEMQAFIQNLH